MPDGLEEAFQQYLNEAPTGPEEEDTPVGDDDSPKEPGEDGIGKDDAPVEDPEQQPEAEPDADGNIELTHKDDLRRKPISKKAKPKSTVIKYGNPGDYEIARAVNERRYVGMYYEEKLDQEKVLKGFRLIEPICFGLGNRMKRKNKKTNKYEYITNNADRKYLRAFVIRDTALDLDTKKQFKTRRKSVSKTKKIPYFRMFRVDRIQSWFAFDFVFSKYRTLYNPKDECMVKIIAALNYEDFPRGEKASY